MAKMTKTVKTKAKKAPAKRKVKSTAAVKRAGAARRVKAKKTVRKARRAA